MTDRELLEAAAKAAGMIYLLWTPGASPIVPTSQRVNDRVCWNPLTDDGDALRLAVKLGISVSQERRNGCVFCDASEGEVTADEEYSGDPYAATRRAITRAAAEMGNK